MMSLCQNKNTNRRTIIDFFADMSESSLNYGAHCVIPRLLQDTCVFSVYKQTIDIDI